MPEGRLELALRDLGRQLDWPAEPRLAAGVAARLREPRRPRRFLPSRRPLLVAFAALAAAVAVAMAVPPARSAILDFFRIGGVEIRRVETLPTLPAERVAPGPRVTLAEAREALPFEPLVPDGYSAVHLERDLVTFVWPDRLLTEFPGDELLLKKVVEQGTRVEWLDIRGYPAVWIEGAPHGFFIPGGEQRLAGNVLLWVRDGVTFRLEGELSLDRARRIAGTLVLRGT